MMDVRLTLKSPYPIIKPKNIFFTYVQLHMSTFPLLCFFFFDFGFSKNFQL